MTNLSGSSESANLVRHFLKFRLKQKKLTYRQLAKKISVSEVTIKRWMSRQDFSFESFVRVCDAIEVNPISIFDNDRAKDSLGHRFTLEQEQYLANHPIHFLILTKALMGASFDQVKAASGYEDRRLLSALRKMENQKFIQLMPQNKFRPKVRGPFHWQPNGPLEQRYFHRFRDVIIEHFRKKFFTTVQLPADDFALFRPFEMYLKPTEVREFSFELAKVLLKYRSLSHGRRAKWADTKPIAGLLALDHLDAWQVVYKSFD